MTWVTKELGSSGNAMIDGTNGTFKSGTPKWPIITITF